MPDTTLSQAIKEAYATAPQVPIYPTIEIRHPEFAAPIRVVQDRKSLTATLEDSAPLNAGEEVTFAGYAFDFTKPELTPQGIPQMQLIIDNVDRAIVAALEQAIATTALVEVTYREYLASDLSGPQNDPPITMYLYNVHAGLFQVTGVLRFPDMMNRRFPTIEYSAEKFPGLVTDQ